MKTEEILKLCLTFIVGYLFIYWLTHDSVVPRLGEVTYQTVLILTGIAIFYREYKKN